MMKKMKMMISHSEKTMKAGYSKILKISRQHLRSQREGQLKLDPKSEEE